MSSRTWLILGLVTVNMAFASIYTYGQVRGRTNFIAASGRYNGQPAQYVLETNSGKLVVFQIDTSKKDMVPVATANIQTDARRAFSR